MNRSNKYGSHSPIRFYAGIPSSQNALQVQTLRRALGHHQSGRLPQAEALYQTILAKDPKCADALHLQGLIALQTGRAEIAANLIRQAVEISPNEAQFHSNLGEAYRGLGWFDEAVESLKRALAIQPAFPEALNRLGAVLAAQQQTANAVNCYREAIRFDPNCADAYYNLGNVLANIGQLAEAEACYKRTVALRPNAIDAHNNLGAVIHMQGRVDEALGAYQRGIALRPNHAESHNNLGNIFKDQGRLEEAIARYRQAIALKPDYSDAHSNLVLALLYHVGDKAEPINGELHRWNRRHAAALAPSILPHANERSPGRRLRIGYVSPDLRDHVIGCNLLPLFERHDHRNFEIFGYSLVPQPDPVTQRIRACCDHWRDVAILSDAQVADRVRQDQIDILVDLTLHLANNRLLVFARKPAPVQVSFAGYPGGSGLGAINYHLTDIFLNPPNSDDALRPDAPYLLPASFWCYAGLAIELPVSPLPAISAGHVTFGCLNNLCKFNAQTLRLWARIMLSVPGSRLMLRVAKGSTRERTLTLFEQAGVATDRLDFVDHEPREKYLTFYHRIDIGLDTFPYNGHTTSLDSFWMGVPVVTLVGSTPVSRAGWSQLSNLGLTELAAHSADAFVHTASTLARDLPRLVALRRGLRERMRRSPLMDGAQFTHGIEAAYRAMWRHWCEHPMADESPSKSRA